jgi:hypothetical protein
MSIVGREGRSHPSVTLPILIRGPVATVGSVGVEGAEESAWARWLGWMDNLWSGIAGKLVLIRSDMKGIFRSVWIVWFDTYQGASRMDRRTLQGSDIPRCYSAASCFLVFGWTLDSTSQQTSCWGWLPTEAGPAFTQTLRTKNRRKNIEVFKV